MMALSTAQHQSMFDMFKRCETVMNPQDDVEERCSNCDSKIMDILGNMRCSNSTCGMIFGGSLDTGAEWRNDPDGEDQTRAGPTIDERFLDSSYSTGFRLQRGMKNNHIFRDVMAKSLHHMSNSEDKSMQDRFKNIQAVCQSHYIPKSIIDQAQDYYYDLIQEIKKEPDYKHRRGNNNEGLQAAAVYCAYQSRGITKTYADIAKVFNVPEKYLINGLKIFKGTESMRHELKANNYSDYIDIFCDRLFMDDTLKKRVREVADKAHELGILDSNIPTAIVAGCIYYVVIENGIANIHKTTIKLKCKVSQPTISSVCDKLCRHARKLL